MDKVERKRRITAAMKEEEGWKPLVQTIIDGDMYEFIEDMDELCEMPRGKWPWN
jgi:hypothetical protein